MAETWYRGEGVGVAPTTPGSTASHDLGDGMYLTNSQSVAKRYAEERSADPAGQRVYSVNVPVENLRILDLTTDPRWKQHMGPMAPGMRSNESIIKDANENYGKFFESFCKKHKINLNDYDAVIGEEFVRGGKQMVILQKGGKTAPLAGTLRGNFKVVLLPGATPTRTPAGALTFKGKIGPGLRTAGATVTTAGIGLLFNWIDGKLRERFAQEELRKMEPKIAEQIFAHTREIADLQLKGGKPFANITITSTTIYNNFGYFTPANEPGASYPLIELGDVKISNQDLKSWNQTRTNGLISPTDTDIQVYSVPVELSKPELELYQAFVLELKWYDDALRSSPATDLARLTRDRQELLSRFNQAFTAAQ